MTQHHDPHRRRHGPPRGRFHAEVAAVLCAVLTSLGGLPASARGAGESLAETVAAIAPQVVKIYGSGGLRGLVAYQSGFLISGDGLVLTTWSHVLDAEEYIVVVLDDGSRYRATLVQHAPRLEVALLKIAATGLPHFQLDAAVQLQVGDRVLAMSNLFGIAAGDERVSVMHGSVSAVSDLAARRGAYPSVYRGPVYVLDAMANNPGAAGGVLTDHRGRLAGMLGKELRSAQDNTWLNYAIPMSQLASAIEAMRSGRNPPRRDDDTVAPPARGHTLAELGVVLVPDILFLSKTPPFVDRVRPGSAATAAGLQADDLIVFVNGRMVSSCREVQEELALVDAIDSVPLTVQRGQELVELNLPSSGSP